MFVHDRNWYALINNQVYAFQSKHQRDICGGEPIKYSDFNHRTVTPTLIRFNDFPAWHAAMQTTYMKEKLS